MRIHQQNIIFIYSRIEKEKLRYRLFHMLLPSSHAAYIWMTSVFGCRCRSNNNNSHRRLASSQANTTIIFEQLLKILFIRPRNSRMKASGWSLKQLCAIDPIGRFDTFECLLDIEWFLRKTTNTHTHK